MELLIGLAIVMLVWWVLTPEDEDDTLGGNLPEEDS